MSAREVELTGGAPWGFRMHGGADQNQPLRISRRYSDSVERALDVNPGRKASLSGIREGDVISTINGRSTRGVTNAEAHALLRQAGPVLKLGLNEDREMSPRRRSIGKGGGELKRPSQLIGDGQGVRATPQAPVYATIRPAPSPLNRPVPPALRSSFNSLPSALTSTPLVRSVGAPEESIKIHPTNPFYTNSPPNSHSSPSKLPVPNGRASHSSLDRTTKSINTSSADNYDGLKSPSFFTKSYDSGSNSLSPGPYLGSTSNVHTNGHSSESARFVGGEVKREPFSYDSLYSHGVSNGLPNLKTNAESSRDPFDTSRLTSDPFEKYLRPNTKGNEYSSSKLSNSLSENNVTEEMTTHSVIEHKISEVEEIETIKKIVLNGSGDETHYTPTSKNNQDQFDFKNNHQQYSETIGDKRREHSRTREYSPSHNGTKDRFKDTERQADGLYSFADQWNGGSGYNTSSFYSTQEKQHHESPTAVDAPAHDVASKPPLRSPNSGAPAQPTSPTAKREYQPPFTLIDLRPIMFRWRRVPL